MNQSNIRSTARRLIALTLIALGTGAVAASASAAAPEADAPSIAVKYGDLNLGTEAGVHALYSRLVRAADRVCGVEYSRNLRVMQTTLACRDQAVARAVREVDSPRLATMAAVQLKAG